MTVWRRTRPCRSGVGKARFASFHGRRAVALIAAASDGGSSPRAGGALARLWLAPALTWFFHVFPVARLARGLCRRLTVLAVPHEIKPSLR